MNSAAEFASAELRPVLEQFAPSRTAMENHPFYLPMMSHVVLCKLRPASAVKKALGDLTEEDGRRIGRSLALSLATDFSEISGLSG